MCQPAKCVKCGKPGYVGCGRHVEQVLGHVPVEERCRCREEAARDPKPSFFDRMFKSDPR